MTNYQKLKRALKLTLMSLSIATFIASAFIQLVNPPKVNASIGAIDFSNVDVIGHDNYGDYIPDDTPVGVPDNGSVLDPYAITMDHTHHKLYVADGGYSSLNRVLVYNLDSQNQLIDNYADYVLGQPDFSTTDQYCYYDGSGTTNDWGFCLPYGVAVDETRQLLFVGDGYNNRVMVFDVSTITNGMSADYVIGQPDFEHGYCNGEFDTASETTLCKPWGLSYDSTYQRLFVADKDNNRVVSYDVSVESLGTGEAAQNVLGQPNFASTDCNIDGTVNYLGLCTPKDVEYDNNSGALYVTDSDNNRITVYDAAQDDISDGMPASIILGQPDEFTADCTTSISGICNPIGVSLDPGTDSDGTGARLFVGEGGANRVMVFNADPAEIATGEDAMNVIGQSDADSVYCYQGMETITADGLCTVRDAYYDPGTKLLYVGEQGLRISIFDADPLTLSEFGETAINFLGQPDGTSSYNLGRVTPNDRGFSSPTSVVTDDVNHKMYVADGDNHRIMVFNLNNDNSIPDRTADYVIGQSNFNISSSHSSDTGMSTPADITIDKTGQRLFVADMSNNRILVYNTDSDSLESGMAASKVLGQNNFDDDSCNQGEDSADANTLCEPIAVRYDPTSHLLYATDYLNGRVLVYDVGINIAAITDGQDAVHILGQTDFHGTTGCAGDTTLPADGFCNPTGIAVDTVSHNLFVADAGNYRILVFNVSELSDGMNAFAAIGRESLTSNEDDHIFANPGGLEVDSDSHRLFAADSSYPDNISVVWEFDVSTIPANLQPAGYIGAEDKIGCAAPASESMLCTPQAISYSSDGHIAVADQGYNRVMIFDVGTTFTAPDHDNDGVSDAIENAGPNEGDANNDGIQDSEQPTVTGFYNPVTGNYAVLEAPGCTNDEDPHVVAESEIVSSDSGFNYPAGMMVFSLNCSSTTVSEYYFGSFDASLLVARKFTTAGGYTTITGATVTNVTIGGMPALKITFPITDGGTMDEGGTVNGLIVDPSGPGLNVVGVPNTGLGGSRII